MSADSDVSVKRRPMSEEQASATQEKVSAGCSGGPTAVGGKWVCRSGLRYKLSMVSSSVLVTLCKMIYS